MLNFFGYCWPSVNSTVVERKKYYCSIKGFKAFIPLQHQCLRNVQRQKKQGSACFFWGWNSLVISVSFSVRIMSEGVCSRNSVWFYLLWLMMKFIWFMVFSSLILIAWFLVCLFLVFFAVLQNDRFLQLLITDDVETAIIMMSVLHNILRINRLVLSMLLFFLIISIKGSSLLLGKIKSFHVQALFFMVWGFFPPSLCSTNWKH